eukprot:CAMPEP_0169289452 /NCGR_PEP_ID=MMETSP1016-20121227/61154_1 /TAXON_ID=342587 /ORGANISM="Karlodinium micrum, Strain CCMP2283" /LENGTH=79 /DNA_ID=CAMNT_0009379857 /DNA_START=263 /DNA_END=498 /DNA_ORIENTATION=+
MTINCVAPEIATTTTVEAHTCLDNEAAEITPRPPIPEIQVKLESLVDQVVNEESGGEPALRDIYLLIHERGRPIEPFFT